MEQITTNVPHNNHRRLFISIAVIIVILLLGIFIYKKFPPKDKNAPYEYSAEEQQQILDNLDAHSQTYLEEETRLKYIEGMNSSSPSESSTGSMSEEEKINILNSLNNR